MPLRIGVDTGGTFTDVVAHDTATGAVHVLKVPSTPGDPGAAILAGIQEGAHRGLWRLDEVASIVHGTTVATNALLQRNGAVTALVTTSGFRDVLEIGRQNRPEMYNLRSRRPPPLIPRELRLEITERMLADGTVETPVDEDEVSLLVDKLTACDAKAVVVGLLNSYVNPAHELQVGRLLAERLPGVTVCLSHEVACEAGEFERLSTAAASGYVQPVVEGYLQKLTASLRSIGVRAPVFVMKSSGGAGSAEAVAKLCVETALSGPAGGVCACVDLSSSVPDGNVIAADMGGTSFDVAVVTAGKPELAREATIGGLPLRVPMLDIHTIGAGGGSIAWVDAGGALRVGPQSAGAQPGPACYGRGGTLPTVTDANLILGRLTESSRLAGGMQLDFAAAATAIEEHVIAPLGTGMSYEAAALGILRVANVSMTAALKKLTIERGVDPRGYTLCPFGGAGPLHGAELAAELGATRVIVPQSPGVFSAMGLLLSNLREDRFTSCNEPLSSDSRKRIQRIAARLIEEATTELQRATIEGELSVTRQAATLRYRGQSNDLSIEWPANAPPDQQTLEDAFHRAHRQRFGFARLDHGVELTGVEVSVELSTGEEPLAAAQHGPPRTTGTRPVWFGDQPYPTSIIDRGTLAPGEQAPGPAVIEQDDTTTIVPPGWSLQVKQSGELLLTQATEARPQ